MTGILIKRGNLDTEIHVEGRQHKETQGADGDLQTGERGLGLILPWVLQRERGLPTPGLWISSLQHRDNKFLLFKPPHLWYFVKSALAN